MDDFSDRIFTAAQDFLNEGGQADAAIFLDICDFDASVDEETIDSSRGIYTQRYVHVRLGCPRIVYDVLSDEAHPIRRAIDRALAVVAESERCELYEVYVRWNRTQLPDEYKERVLAAGLSVSRIQPNASKTVAETQNMPVDNTLCFVIMSFSGNPQLKDFYFKAVKPTVESLGYRCERVDEQQFNGSIRDQILHNIRHARFIIADMTEARPNCYYELGIAHALGKQVIHITRNIDDAHFDVRGFNFVIYSDIDGLRLQLRERIKETVTNSIDPK